MSDMAHHRRKRPTRLGLPRSVGDQKHIQREKFLETEGAHSFEQYESYKYSSIGDEQVRLLTLLGGQPQDRIHCLLEVVDFSELKAGRHRYDVLSYAWGKEDPIHPILIEDKNTPIRQGAKKLSIRPNLYRALRRLREKPEFSIRLWIDAICIDQVSPVEKTHQLGKMLHIYNRAAYTRIWLGESNTGGTPAERGMEFVEHIVDINMLDDLLVDENYILDWLAFGELLSKDWFSRRWIIQEVAASRFASIRFGGVEIRWRDFADAIEIFHRSLERLGIICSDTSYATLKELQQRSLPARSMVETTINIFRHWEGESDLQSRRSLEKLVMKLSGFNVSDPRDTIYAFLGIAQDSCQDAVRDLSQDEQILTGSYNKPPLEVYIDFVRYVVSKTRSLDIICRKWASPVSQWSLGPDSELDVERRPSLPTWIGVVDSSSTEPSFIGGPGEVVYNACQNFKAECLFGMKNQKYDGMLSATGIIIGRITRTWEKVISHLDDLLEGPNQLQPFASRELSVPGWLWRTLVADRDHAGKSPPRWYQRACHYWLAQESSHSEIVTAYLKRVEEVVLNRRLLYCERQSDISSVIVGIGPGKAKPGDIVCILFGCSVPVILREEEESTDGTNFHRLIGDAYVHGKMEGESFLGKSQESIREQASIFNIR